VAHRDRPNPVAPAHEEHAMTQYSFLTQDDVQNYGGDLVDFAQRAAAHAMAPHLQDLQQQNAELKNRLDQQTRRDLNATLDAQLPNWRDIDSSPGWRQWLAQPDPLSGIERQRLLNDAIQRGHSSRVLGFFNGFLQENTGHYDSGYEQSQRARRRVAASGQPGFTREQIAKMYRLRQQGYYDDQQWARLEAQIIAAGREGRIAGGLDLNGK
jgi:hypothetical protein